MNLSSFFNKILAIAVFSVLAACSAQNELIQLGEENEFILNRITISGEVCTTAPPALPIKNYILFILDRSDSMLLNESSWIDPMTGLTTNTTKEAVRDVNDFVINATASGINDIYVGIITYSTVTNVIAPFTLGGVTDTDINNIPDATGSTNIADAITVAENEIDNVVSQALATGDNENAIYSFTVIKAGDGEPDNTISGTQIEETTDEILARVRRITRFDQIHPWVQTRMAANLLVGADLLADSTLLAQVRDLYISMATEFVESGSGGTYIETIADPGNPQAFTFDPPNVNPIIGPNQIKSLFVSNINVIPDATQGFWNFVVDSDGDGLSDAEENSIGTDPTIADTDGDGCSDHTESTTNFDPLMIDCDCSDPTDTDDPDGDSLLNCEEKIFNTDLFHPDSDRDGIPDRFEIINKMNANDLNDALLDKDGDSTNNKEELFFHLDVNNSNPAGTNGFSYDYTINTGQINAQGEYCVTFEVRNVMVDETLNGGVNNIQVIALEDSSNDALDQSRYNIVTLQTTFINNDIQGASSFTIETTDWTSN